MSEKKPYRVTQPTTYHWPGDTVWLTEEQVLSHHEPINAVLVPPGQAEPFAGDGALMIEGPHHDGDKTEKDHASEAAGSEGPAGSEAESGSRSEGHHDHNG